VRGLGQEAPEPRGVGAWDRRRDVLRRVAQVDGVYLGGACGAEEAGRQGQNAAAVGGGCFGEDADDFVGVCGCEVGEGDEFGVWGWGELGRGEGEENGAEEGYALDIAGVWVGACEDWLEDGGEVEGVEGRGEGAGDDGASFWEVVFGRVELSGCTSALMSFS
jgi:hypothetical protein